MGTQNIHLGEMHVEQLILVRYGQYENGHLTTEGTATMTAAAGRIKNFLLTRRPIIISAPTTRATESAKIIGEAFGISQINTYPQIYAADEDGLLPDCPTAAKLIDTLGAQSPIVIAVVSREYIETLPNFILKTVFAGTSMETSLNRGEALVIDYTIKDISYLR